WSARSARRAAGRPATACAAPAARAWPGASRPSAAGPSALDPQHWQHWILNTGNTEPSSGRPEAVADAALGVDQRRAERVELAAQVADVRLEHLGLPGVLPAPDVVEQLLSGQHQALVAHQVGEQPELGGRQFDLNAGPVDRPVVLVELQ